MARKKAKRKSELQGFSILSLVTAIIGLVGGMFFLSTNVTGSVIGNFSNSSISILGLVLFALGIISGSFYVRGRRR